MKYRHGNKLFRAVSLCFRTALVVAARMAAFPDVHHGTELGRLNADMDALTTQRVAFTPYCIPGHNGQARRRGQEPVSATQGSGGHGEPVRTLPPGTHP